MTRFVGGPFGRHARGPVWFASPAPVAILLGTIVWVITILRQNPCRQTELGVIPDHFQNQCYSDIPVLFGTRGLMDGNTPYLDSGDYHVLEYPVLTGWLIELNRLITVLLGAPVGPGLEEVDRMAATNLFYSVNMVVLFVFWLVTILAHLGSARGRGWDSLMLVAAPGVVLTGLINWDMLPLALTAVGVMFWARRRPGWAGLFWGLAMAAKLYAGFFLGPLLFLCLRAGRMKEFARTVAFFVVGWLVPNLPVMVLAWDEWVAFWSFNSDRAGDFGSIWYLFVLNDTPLENLNLISTGLFAVLCLGIAALILLAPQRPRLGQVFFLVLMAFMLTNKVYSPQYVLWVLPFLALCRPRWRDWVIFSIGEWLYVMAIWGHLGGYIGPGDGGPDKLFWAATILRMGTQAWVVGIVIRDILRPRLDQVRATAAGRGYVDDPSGGVLDGAPDMHWIPARRDHQPVPSWPAQPHGPGDFGQAPQPHRLGPPPPPHQPHGPGDFGQPPQPYRPHPPGEGDQRRVESS
ncbi:MAG: glycosyltransferase 87 family protein [Propionibacteriaceae bacterium]|nr:glycosyltransferase 87 family protein [Propionibacteriaceae bacterium]